MEEIHGAKWAKDRIMTTSDFWHQAFIAALTRLPAEEAKAEADRAFDLAVDHWDEVKKRWGGVVQVWAPYDQLDITNMGRPAAKAT